MNDLAVVEAGASEHSAKSVLQAVEFFFLGGTTCIQ